MPAQPRHVDSRPHPPPKEIRRQESRMHKPSLRVWFPTPVSCRPSAPSRREFAVQNRLSPFLLCYSHLPPPPREPTSSRLSPPPPTQYPKPVSRPLSLHTPGPRTPFPTPPPPPPSTRTS